MNMNSLIKPEFSIVGIILMAASAISAALVSNEPESNAKDNGSLLLNSASGGMQFTLSCKPGDANVCTATINSETTGSGYNHSFNESWKQTVGNTSQTVYFDEVNETSKLQ